LTAIQVAASTEDAARCAANRIAEAIDQARDARGVAHVALAGGTTPRRAYELLAARASDWSGVEIWFGDERAVGPRDPESNYRMVAETLLAGEPEAIPRVHRIVGERGADEAADAYTAELLDRLPLDEHGTPVLDLALLGLGPEGHTASLFPGSPVLEATGVCAAVHGAPKPPPDRITLTVRALRAARRILFLATGADKAKAVEGLLDEPDPSLPASLLAGPRTELIVDSAAGRAITARP
jgi:6-phosphogluconolactonase